MKPFDKEALKRKYTEICPKYKKLAKNLKQAFKIFLDDAGIGVLDVVHRIKEFDSFWDKIQRKDYKDPFQEIEDICGLRIICFYPSDLEKISQIINSEFDVKESIDKANLLEPDRFGYRSLHFILTVKKDWLKTPNYRGLDGLEAEVQVCTILMHAWANIEHKLAYKKKEHVPNQLKRKLYQLSALFEVADGQFDTLRKEKEEYREHLISEEAKKNGRFDVGQQMNFDSLQAFLDFYFPDRQKSIKHTSDLLDELVRHKISMKKLVEAYESVKDFLPAIEQEIFKEVFKGTEKHRRWVQVGVVRNILDLTNNDYWQFRKTRLPRKVVQFREKWRTKIFGWNR